MMKDFIEKIKGKYKINYTISRLDGEDLTDEDNKIIQELDQELKELNKQGYKLSMCFTREPVQKPINNSGMICDQCGSLDFVQTGSCLTCIKCGTSVGGCG